MLRKLSGLGLALLLAGVIACSEAPSKKKQTDFFQKMEQESEALARRKVKERKEQEARQKQQTEDYYKRLAEEAARANPAPAASSGETPAAPAADVQYVMSDKDLTFLVLNKIRLLQHRSTVSVECKDGVVKLFGETDSEETKKHLVGELRKLPGVRKVDASELYLAAK